MFFKLIALLILFIISPIVAKTNNNSSLNNPSHIENKLTKNNDELISYRLPNDTIPLTYDITLETRINEGNFTFSGNVKIVIECINEIETITLHARQLNIINVYLWTIGHTDIYINWVYDSVTEFITINLQIGSLVINNFYTIEIDYIGTLRDDQAGFYHSSYLDNNQNRRYLATTQFQPTDARHGFPCYDEPSIKSYFTIRIIHHQSYTAISNMPVASTTSIINQMITTEFQQTPLMSTYLIAFIISNFEFHENVQSSVVHRVYARPNVLIDQIELPLSNGVQILNELQTYLNIPYLLTKIDQVAVPDFAGGAMENWGLVTYRETSLLWDNTISSYINRRSIIRLISHEFTHQWFGNLVSPQWWSYLWLNEGFATLFANYIVDKIYPEFKLMEQMVVHTMHNVMKSDALQSTHPMSYYVESPNELENIFDSIAYDKAACVLRMFMNAFTENSFQKGLNYYLTERSHNYTTEEHLFIGLERAVKEDNTLAEDKNVLTIMSSWTQQNGYPILYVNRNYNTDSILIGQQRYFTYPPETLTNTKYWIPINFVSAQELDFSQTYTTEWLSDNLKTIEKNTNREWSSNDWLIFNKQQSSYYRIQYDQTNWNLIINELLYGDFKKIHVLNRAQIIDDSFTLAEANRLNWNVPLTIMKYLFKEYEYIPWAAFENHLNYFNRYLPGIYNYGNYQNFIQQLIEHLFNEYGIIDNGIDELLSIKYIRTLAIHWSCAMGLNLCREMTNLRLKELINNNNEIHPNLKNVLYCAGLRTANSNDKEYFLNRIMSTSTVSNIEQNFIINGLGCISNINLLYEYLMESLNVSLTQNIRNGIFNAVYQNSQNGLYLAIVFLTNNFEQSNVIFGNDESVKTTLIELSKLCSTEYIIVAMENLLNVARTNIDFENSIKIAHDNIFVNIEWLIINEYNIINWLSKNNLDN